VSTTGTSAGSRKTVHDVDRSPGLMLFMATLGFAVNFWAWALLSPLGPLFREQGTLGSLSESDVALLVAVPVIVGSLGRIVVGALTDRFGGRVMFPLVSAVTIVPILFIAFAGLSSYALLLVGGFFLGIAGTAFAVGVPFVNAWFPPERRGLAIGIFGAGMGGTAISALTTVKLYTNVGEKAPFLITAAVLAVYAAAAWLVLRDAPGRTVPTAPLAARLVATARLPITWQACILYAVAFGGYVAFSVYLPAYLKTAYALTPADAANRMAGFVVVAVLMRPVGGWLSDKFGPIPVLVAGYGVVVVGAAVAATNPILEHVGTVAFLGMAAALGSGAGATFALVARVTEPSKVGGVTGLVGAAGGLGGFVPPLLMGYIYGRTESYSLGLALLSVTAALALLLTLTVVRRTASRGTPAAPARPTIPNPRQGGATA
jgi:MFS transporter, NNP family, nitrate/nitrite transporter